MYVYLDREMYESFFLNTVHYIIVDYKHNPYNNVSLNNDFFY